MTTKNQPKTKQPNPPTDLSTNIVVPAINKKALSKWAIVGLDLKDSGFSKLHNKESTFNEKIMKKYDLNPESWDKYKEV